MQLVGPTDRVGCLVDNLSSIEKGYWKKVSRKDQLLLFALVVELTGGLGVGRTGEGTQ
jgi:hypothetical protein